MQCCPWSVCGAFDCLNSLPLPSIQSSSAGAISLTLFHMLFSCVVSLTNVDNHIHTYTKSCKLFFLKVLLRWASLVRRFDFLQYVIFLLYEGQEDTWFLGCVVVCPTTRTMEVSRRDKLIERMLIIKFPLSVQSNNFIVDFTPSPHEAILDLLTTPF
jgi:hypothetical protein